jgi:hypothetical protein
MLISRDSANATDVCGIAAGLWDIAGSPYNVTCDVTVPTGQTLTIQPGVNVLFAGHYKFIVNGNLQAMGTEQDSIMFTRAFPTEESKWWGIRFLNAGDTSRLAYCRIEWGHAEGGSNPFYDYYGGGIDCENSPLVVTHSLLTHNASRYDGGAINIKDCSPLILNTTIADNVALDDGAGGGISVWPNSSPRFERCVISSNSADNGGGVYCRSSAPLFVNCDFIGNTASGPVHSKGGALAVVLGGQPTLRNCIVWGNQATTDSAIWIQDGSVACSYSDVPDGYPGAGNISTDPAITDLANRDFHLLATSPCIDAGDPDSPRDPDSTRADIGAYPFTHCGLMVNPFSLEFGLLDLGNDSTLSLSLFNPTSQAIPLSMVRQISPVFTVDTNGLGGQIAPFSDYDCRVRFLPASSGAFADTLELSVVQPCDSTYRIPLQGQAQVILPPVDSLVAQKGPLNGIRLDWAPVTHSITGRPVEDVVYVVYGSVSPSGPFTPFGYATTNTFTHPYILNTQPTYFYRVTADVPARSDGALER